MMLHYSLTTQSVLLTDLHRATQNVGKLSLDSTNTVVTGMLTELGIPSFNTLIHNYNVSFENRLKTCDNTHVKHIVLFYDTNSS